MILLLLAISISIFSESMIYSDPKDAINSDSSRVFIGISAEILTKRMGAPSFKMHQEVPGSSTRYREIWVYPNLNFQLEPSSCMSGPSALIVSKVFLHERQAKGSASARAQKASF